jgi:hypothetical protein
MLFVDVDGVLNPWGHESYPDTFRQHHLFPEEDEPVRLASVHGNWLRELATLFVLVWASAWGADAHRLLAPILLLDEYPHVPMPMTPFPPEAKVTGIAAFAGERAAAWLDDVMVPEAYAWAEGREAPTLLIEVDHTTGIAFARSDGSGATPGREPGIQADQIVGADRVDVWRAVLYPLQTPRIEPVRIGTH